MERVTMTPMVDFVAARFRDMSIACFQRGQDIVQAQRFVQMLEAHGYVIAKRAELRDSKEQRELQEQITLRNQNPDVA